MNDSVKCTFRQRTVEQLYRVGVLQPVVIDRSGAITEVAKGVTPAKSKYPHVIADEVICECEMQKPLLKVGEHIIISDTGKKSKITEVIRCTDGSIVYYVEDKAVDTEESEKSRKEAADIVAEAMTCRMKYEQLIIEFESYKMKYRYPNRFFNRNSDDLHKDEVIILHEV